MSDESRELLHFLGTCVIGLGGCGVLLGHAIATNRTLWVVIGIIAVTTMGLAFSITFGWLMARRQWEDEHDYAREATNE